MMMVNLSPQLAPTFRLSEGLAEPEWHRKRTPLGLVLNIRWKHQARPSPGEVLLIRIPGEES